MMISANTSSYMDKDEQERCESVAEFSVGKTGHNHCPFGHPPPLVAATYEVTHRPVRD